MASRIPFRNNARLILAYALGALAVLLGMSALLRTSRDFSPDFLASVLLYALTVLNISLLLILLVVLGRNLVRVFMERRRGGLGARFQMRLVLVFMLMAVAPSLLLLLVGSDLIRQTVDRWFNVDVERILSSSQALGVALRQSHTDGSRIGAGLLARELQSQRLLEPARQGRLRRTVERRVRELHLDMVGVFTRDGELLAVVDPRLPPVPAGAVSGQALAQTVISTAREAEARIPHAGGELVMAAAPVRGHSGGSLGAVVVASYLPAEVMAESKEVERRYTKFRKVQAFKEPIKAVYLSIYALAALLVLFGAVWLSVYLARRITVPLRMVADGAERIASGERGVQVALSGGDDEFTALIASFNHMSERLARSEEAIERSRQGLARKNRELEERRRLTETVLETVGTGILVVDGSGRATAANAAALYLLDLDAGLVGRPVARVLEGRERAEILELVERLLAGRGGRQEREVVLPSHGRDRHLAVTVAPLPTGGGVVVLDDLTPLMRAQRVAAWGEVARKLAHEIKNPLTPIQLSAQRVRKAYLKSAPDFEQVLTECTRTIVDEVDALKNLVDEFSQFARLPAANLSVGSLHDVVEQALSLYDGLFGDVRLERHLDPRVPPLRLDAAQMKRVIINLVDNAIEATERRGRVHVATEYDLGEGRVRLVVSDDGPGIPEADRERLFVPHFSTKKRGSGLGLSIVSRIVQEHHGSVRVEANVPRGARFVIELPA